MATKNITIKLIIHKSTNKVAFAECGKDFVDVLLSILTLPLGTIVRISDKHSLHCIDNLYKSVEILDKDYFNTEACRSMLLHPFNAVEEKCKGLKVHVGNTPPLRYFICPSRCNAGQLSVFPSTRCSCGKAMNIKVNLLEDRDPCDGTVFVKGGKGLMRFAVSDNMLISPATTESLLVLCSKLGLEDNEGVEELEVHVGSSKVLQLIKRSLCSNTPLTDVFLVGQNEISPTQLVNGAEQPRPIIRHKTTSQSTKISLKLVVSNHDRKLLYAESSEDFVNLLFSFLTYPVGSLVEHLGGQSHVLCIDNLYKSVTSLNSASCIKDDGSKEILLSPKLPLNFGIMNRLVGLVEEEPERFYMCRKDDCDFKHLSTIPNVKCGCKTITNKKLKLVDPKHIPNDEETTGGFLRSATYILDDNLVAKPVSSILSVSGRLKQALKGVTVITVEIGEEEALALLQASITSKTPLSDVLVTSKIGPDDGQEGKELGEIAGS